MTINRSLLMRDCLGLAVAGGLFTAVTAQGIRKPSMDDTIKANVYADNWFQMYINGELVAVDSIKFIPHNVVSVDLLPSYPMTIAVMAKDNADPKTGMEYANTNIGDAGFILGIGASYLYAHTVDWGSLNSVAERLTTPTATVIALCFAVAAFAKSVQLPFTPWLGRAMEGPTPSSAVFYGAVMVHSGVYLVILLEPIFERAPAVMLLMVIVGLITAIYSFVVGLTQTDVKSSLCFATSGQLGLMFLECGLGLWQLASWHLCAHAIVRGYQVLTAPSLMHNVLGNPIKPVSRASQVW